MVSKLDLKLPIFRHMFIRTFFHLSASTTYPKSYEPFSLFTLYTPASVCHFQVVPVVSLASSSERSKRRTAPLCVSVCVVLSQPRRRSIDFFLTREISPNPSFHAPAWRSSVCSIPGDELTWFTSRLCHLSGGRDLEGLCGTRAAIDRRSRHRFLENERAPSYKSWSNTDRFVHAGEECVSARESANLLQILICSWNENVEGFC